MPKRRLSVLIGAMPEQRPSNRSMLVYRQLQPRGAGNSLMQATLQSVQACSSQDAQVVRVVWLDLMQKLAFIANYKVSESGRHVRQSPKIKHKVNVPDVLDM